MVGSNIPHYWHSDDIFYNNPKDNAKLVNIHFEYDFAGMDFFNITEMKAARSLLERARQGIHVYGYNGQI